MFSFSHPTISYTFLPHPPPPSLSFIPLPPYLLSPSQSSLSHCLSHSSSIIHQSEQCSLSRRSPSPTPTIPTNNNNNKKHSRRSIMSSPPHSKPFNPFCEVDQSQISIHCHINAVRSVICVPGMVPQSVGELCFMCSPVKLY